MKSLTHLSSVVAVAGLVATTAGPARADDPKAVVDRLQEATSVLRELVRTPDEAIPQHILDRAEAVVVIPTLVKGGFIVGAEHGRGVMSVRDRVTNAWSLPAFVAMTGGSVGWQVGVQSTDLVLLVMNREGVDDLLKSEFRIGADASVAAGPVGRSAQASTDATMGAKILAYSRSKGLFAGLSLQGTTVREDTEANADFYGKPTGSTAVFAMKTGATAPAAAETWRNALTAIAPFSK